MGENNSIKKRIFSNITDDLTLTNVLNFTYQPTNLFFVNSSRNTYIKYTSDNFTYSDGLVSINLTISNGENNIYSDCLEPFDNILIRDNLTLCNWNLNVDNISINSNSRVTLNSNLTTERLIIYNGSKFIRNNGGKLIIL